MSEYFGVGFEVALISPGRILDGFDRQMADLVADSMEEKKIRILKGIGPIRIEKATDGSLIVFFWTHGILRKENFNTVLFATGREAALEHLRLENVGVTLRRSKLTGTREPLCPYSPTSSTKKKTVLFRAVTTSLKAAFIKLLDA